jgi:hypothetical protein
MRGDLVVMSALAIFLMLAEPASAQCSMCRRVLDSPEGQALAAALRQGILVLLATPFVLVAAIATLAVRAQRRARHPRNVPPPARQLQ